MAGWMISGFQAWAGLVAGLGPWRWWCLSVCLLRGSQTTIRTAAFQRSAAVSLGAVRAGGADYVCAFLLLATSRAPRWLTCTSARLVPGTAVSVALLVPGPPVEQASWTWENFFFRPGSFTSPSPLPLSPPSGRTPGNLSVRPHLRTRDPSLPLRKTR